MGNMPKDDEPFLIPPNPVKITWHSNTETVDGEFDHAILVVPDKDGKAHRVYFVGQNLLQLGKLTATVMEMAAKNAGGRPMEIALAILQAPSRNDERDGFRGIPYKHGDNTH